MSLRCDCCDRDISVPYYANGDESRVLCEKCWSVGDKENVALEAADRARMELGDATPEPEEPKDTRPVWEQDFHTAYKLMREGPDGALARCMRMRKPV